MNDDLERLEALYHDIIAARAAEPSDSKMCVQRQLLFPVNDN